MNNYLKNIHIGEYIKELVQTTNTNIDRICNFLSCSEEEVEIMYTKSSLNTEILLRWSKLLEFNFFRLYTGHLQIYCPIASTTKMKNTKELSSVEKQVFKKNIYSQEVINFILDLINQGTLSKTEIMKKYNIPKTTLYRWLTKYSNREAEQIEKEPKNKLEKNSSRINYQRIFIDLLLYKYPEKLQTPDVLLQIKNISNSLDVIRLSEKLQLESNKEIDQKLKAYDEASIQIILKEKEKYQLSNTEVANMYETSRNTISKWQTIYNN